MSGEQAAFGALLRELRLAASQTIEGLAEASGVSVRGIGDLERGRRAAPQRRTVAALADGLGLDETLRERPLAAARGRDAPPATARWGCGRSPGAWTTSWVAGRSWHGSQRSPAAVSGRPSSRSW